MSIIALSPITRICFQPEYLINDERYILTLSKYTIEYYETPGRDKLVTFAEHVWNWRVSCALKKSRRRTFTYISH